MITIINGMRPLGLSASGLAISLRVPASRIEQDIAPMARAA